MTQYSSKIMAAALASSALTAMGAPTLAMGQTTPIAAVAIAQTTPLGAVATAPTTQVDAIAQNQSRPQNADTGSEVVVTGSRVARAGFIAPTPQIVLGQQEIQERGEINTIDLLTDLPQFFGNSNTSSSGEGSTTTGGQSFANMRDLGANRTLVLFNGQRFVPTTGIETIDVSLFPDILINRIDVVTGGASAAYGSDAVAGVTNFGIDTKFKGLKGDIEGGAATAGDDVSRRIGLAAGSDIGDRLSFVASAEYYRNDGVPPLARPWSQSDAGLIANPAYVTGGAAPGFLLQNYLYEGHATNGGLIVGGPLNNTQFLPGGGTSTYTPCSTLGNASLQACPTPTNLPFGQAWQWDDAPTKRYSGYGRLAYQVNAGTSVYADVLVAGSNTFFNSVPPVSSVYGLRTISITNAYLPASIVSQMQADKITSFSLGSGFADLDNVKVNRENYVLRTSVGFNSDLTGSWKIDGYATYGQSIDDFVLRDDTITTNFNNALAAVVSPSTGQIVCQSTLTAPTNGCVPLNVFGGGPISPAAQAYIVGAGYSHLVSKQLATAINLHGDLFSTWAGPVSVAVGGEYRLEDEGQYVDAVSAAKGFVNGNPQPYSGANNVKEVYGEAVIPLAKDITLLKSLELNVAGRVTDYRFSGSVETWKVGATYEPIQGLRFRATDSQDIRAPNLTEILGTGSRGAPTVVDPFENNTQVGTISYPLGNTALVPEVAKTTSVGIVVQPTFLQGFQASVDYYSIKLEKEIGSLTAQQMLTLCYDGGPGSSVYCNNIIRNANGTLNYINLPELNLGALDTSGIDFEVSYARPLWGQDRLTARLLVNNLLQYQVETNVISGTINDLGIIQPSWTGNVLLVYDNGPDRKFIFSARYIGAGVFGNTAATAADQNKIPYVWYVDGGFEQRFAVAGKPLTFFFNMKNILNKAPPLGDEISDGSNYDLIGRRFETGLRFKF